MSNSSRMPVPMAVISGWISVFESTLSMRFFSTLMILPRSGRIACVLRSRPCLAEPPAESPSTTKSSTSAGSLDRLLDDLVALRGVLLEELGEALVDRRLYEALHGRVAELRLRLAL